MKTLIFILLKIGEICLIPIAYLLISYLGYLLSPFVSRITNVESMLCHDWYFISNFFIVIAFMLILLIIYLLYILFEDLFTDWIKSNKKLTEKIYKKFKK